MVCKMLFQCILQAGYINPNRLRPGIHMGQYGVFFWVECDDPHSREGRAQAVETAMMIRSDIERRHSCRLYPPEVQRSKLGPQKKT